MSIQGGSFGDALSERERAQVARLLSDPFSFPMIFKTWLAGYLEEMNPALVTLQGSGSLIVGDFNAHVANPSGAHAASAISFIPYGTIAATNVQSAIQEMLDESAPSASLTMEDSVALHG